MVAMAMASAMAIIGSLGAIYHRYRLASHFRCHFCLRPTRHLLPVSLRAIGASFYCPYDDCAQYNGFTSAGDYNRQLPELTDPARNQQPRRSHYGYNCGSSSPVLCAQCQCQQALKIAALAHDDQHGGLVEERFALCDSCSNAVDAHLRLVAHRHRPTHTPLQISNEIGLCRHRFAIHHAALLVGDFMLFMSTLAPLLLLLRQPLPSFLLHSSLLSFVGSNDPLILLLKLVAIAGHRPLSYTLLTITDLLLSFVLYFNLINPMPTLLAISASLRLLSFVFLIVQRCSPSSNVPSAVRSNPFNCPSSSTPRVFNVSPSSTRLRSTPHPLLAPSRLAVPKQRLHDELSCIDSCRQTTMENLIASISLTAPSPQPQSTPHSAMIPRVLQFSSLLPPIIAFLTSSAVHYRIALIVPIVVGGTIGPSFIAFAALSLLIGPFLNAIITYINAFLPPLEVVALLATAIALLIDWTQFANEIRRIINKFASNNSRQS